MHLTHFQTVLGLLTLIIGVLVPTAGGLGWVYRKGGASREQLLATQANTAAHDKLSASFDLFTDKIHDTLADHETRITRAEDRIDSLRNSPRR